MREGCKPALVDARWEHARCWCPLAQWSAHPSSASGRHQMDLPVRDRDGREARDDALSTLGACSPVSQSKLPACFVGVVHAVLAPAAERGASILWSSGLWPSLQPSRKASPLPPRLPHLRAQVAGAPQQARPQFGAAAPLGSGTAAPPSQGPSCPLLVHGAHVWMCTCIWQGVGQLPCIWQPAPPLCRRRRRPSRPAS